MAEANPSRYVRLLQSSPELVSMLGPRVPWLSRLDVHSHTLKLVDNAHFVSGNIVGLDAASAAAVEALDVRPGHDVLDLCCAPGGKLAAMAQLMQHSGTIVGVDVSTPRLDTTKAVFKKYRIACPRAGVTEVDNGNNTQWNMSLFLADGVSFHPVKNPGVAVWTTDMDRIFFSTKVGEARKHANKSLRKQLSKSTPPSIPELFDRVMVDAECSTDARKTADPKPEYKKSRTPVPVEEISKLQLELLTNGFRLLKPGGSLAYCTCSHDEEQNESVIGRFLIDHRDAHVVGIDALKDAPATRGTKIPESLLFSPQVSDTSGMFICKIVKAEAP